MSTSEPEEAKKTTKSTSWRIVYSNVTGVKFNDNEAQLTFAIDLNPSKPNTDILEEVVVVLTPKSLKLLTHTLGSLISNFEATVGPITVPAGKLEKISEDLKKQQDAHKAALAAKNK